MSHVFLAGDFAYKLKKPVKFPFLDASRLSQRKTFCQLELSLNRRLAPSVYLRTVPVVETADGLQLGGRRRGKIVEWLVKMRRLPEERMLDQLIARHRVSRHDMTRLADCLVTFFKHAARGPKVAAYGTPQRVSELVLGNLSECQPFIGTLLTQADREFMEAAYRGFLTLYEPLLAARFRQGWIIDGHGDLRCENICMTKPIAVFDCVEFQPAFRCGDVVNDFSFLVMDLECRGRHDLAKTLIARYRHAMRDPAFDTLLPFYKCHRSLVRGKVRGFAWLQHPRTTEGRRIRALARAHFALALTYARQLAKPRVVVVGGLIGTGKSTLAKGLAERFGAHWLRTDEIRLREFAHLRRTHQEFAEGLYAPRVSDRVYRRLIQRAEALIREGHSVVCDGTFSKAEGREALRQMAQRHGASFHFFECVVPRAVAMRRVAHRAAACTDLSEAKPEHYDALRAGYESADGWPAHLWTRLSTDGSPLTIQQRALAVLQRVASQAH